MLNQARFSLKSLFSNASDFKITDEEFKKSHFTDYELEVQREYKAPKVTITVRAGMKI